MKIRLLNRKVRFTRYGGFTLIELLVVIAILGIVTSVIAACLSGGINVWEKARNLNKIEAEAFVGLAVIEEDLNNTFSFYDISFDGDDTHMSFPSLIVNSLDASSIPASFFSRESIGEQSDLPENSRLSRRIGTVKYLFDRNTKSMLRGEWIYPEEEPLNGKFEKLVAGLNDVKLSYFVMPDGKQSSGSAQWNDKTNFPHAVSIELVFGGGQGKDQIRISRKVYLKAVSMRPSNDAGR